MELGINSAISRGFFQQVRFLAELGYSVNQRDNCGRTPLMNCALVEDQSWGVGLARILIEKGASLNLRDPRGLNALHYACIYRRERLVKLYLGVTDFDLGKGDNHGNHALHHSVAKGDVQITKYLMSAYQKYGVSLDRVNKHGATALLQAWRCGQVECARLLEQAGADTGLADGEGCTPQQLEAEYESRKRAEAGKVQTQIAAVQPRYMLPRRRPQSPMYRPSSRASTKGWEQTQPGEKDEEEPNHAVTVNKLFPGQLYRSASHSDLRNNPEYIFRLTAADCFLDSEANESRRRRHSTASSQPSQRSSTQSWRHTMRDLYSSYFFQFTDSYCPVARIPETDQLSDGDPEDIGDAAISGHVRRVAGEFRKGTKGTGWDSLVPQRRSSRESGGPPSRKSSTGLGPFPNNTAKSPAGSLDSCSSESIPSLYRQGKRRQAGDDSGDSRRYAKGERKRPITAKVRNKAQATH